eukprot:PhF_6_TR38250/c0_g1_i1/m.57098
MDAAPSAKLFLWDIPDNTTPAEIRSTFSTFGDIVCIRIPHQKHFAFLEYRKTAMAEKALEAHRLQKLTVRGSIVNVKYNSNATTSSKSIGAVESSRLGPPRQSTNETETLPEGKRRKYVLKYVDELLPKPILPAENTYYHGWKSELVVEAIKRGLA